jgi:gliding motility-associated-like protein
MDAIEIEPHHTKPFSFNLDTFDTIEVNDHKNLLKLTYKINTNTPDTTLAGIRFSFRFHHLYCDIQEEEMRINGIMKGKAEAVDASCKNSSNGVIRIYETFGGYEFPEFSIDSGATWNRDKDYIDHSFYNMPQGTYSVLMRDRLDKDNVITIGENLAIGYKTPFNYELNTRDTSTCGSSFAFKASGDSILAYKWIFQNKILSKDSVFLPDSSGEYRLILTDTRGCDYHETVNFYSLDPKINLIEKIDKTIIGKQNIPFRVELIYPTVEYDWDFPETYGLLTLSGFNNTNAEIDFHSVTVKAAPLKIYAHDLISGCKDTLIHNIEIYKPNPLRFELNVINESCPFEKDGKISLNVSGAEENIDNLIVKDEDDIDLIQDFIPANPLFIEIENLSEGYYFISATSFGVDQKDTTIYIGYDKVTSPDTSFLDLRCKGDIAKIIISHSDLKSITWDNNNIVKNEDFFTTSEPGNYNAFLEYNNFCPDTLSFNIAIPDSIEYSVQITKNPFCFDLCDGEIFIEKHSETENSAVLEYKGNFSRIDYTANIFDLCAGEYFFYVENNRCNYDTIQLEILHELCTYVPNTITPNSDGIHDYWDLSETLELYPNAIVMIYNRWGKKIFESEEGYPEPFDGKESGKPLHAGTYYYIILLDDNMTDRAVTGYLTILR